MNTPVIEERLIPRQALSLRSLCRGILSASPATAVFVLLLGAGCTSADFDVASDLELAEITIDTSAPDELAHAEIEVTLTSGRLVHRCIDTELVLKRESDPSFELVLEFEPDAGFDPCFDGEETRSVTFHNETMSNVDLLDLCEEDVWDLVLFTEIKSNEKSGWGLTFMGEGLSIDCE